MKAKLETQIDELYAQPLHEFTKARNALAKTLSGQDKNAIASLVKPSLAMWVVNQLYWQDAPTYPFQGWPMAQIRFDRHPRFEELSEWLRALAAEHPHLLRLSELGRSHEGREIWLATVTNESTGPHHDKHP